MELTAARKIANDLIAQHGLDALRWTFRFDRAEKRLGLCTYSTRTISMGQAYVLAADEESVTQTMLHEVAHALVGSGAGHGPIWKAKARQIGYTGARTAENPHAKSAQEKEIERAKALAPTVAHLTDGPLRIGELVVMRDGRRAGMLVKFNRTTVLVMEGNGSMVRIPETMLVRQNRAAGVVLNGNGAPLSAPTPYLGEGYRIRSRASGRIGRITIKGRSRVHFVDELTGQVYSNSFAGVDILDRGVGTNPTEMGARYPEPAADRPMRPATVTRPAVIGFQAGMSVVLHFPGSKYHGLTGTVSKVNTKTVAVATSVGVIRAQKSLVRAA